MSLEVVVNNRFVLGEKVGSGSFGKIYSGWLSMHSEFAAIEADCGLFSL